MASWSTVVGEFGSVGGNSVLRTEVWEAGQSGWRGSWLRKGLLGASRALQSGGKNQKCSTSGLVGSMTLAAWVVPNASKMRRKSEVCERWAKWLHGPYRPEESPSLHRRVQRCPERWPGGYITFTAWWVPNTSQGKRKSEGPLSGLVAT